MPPRPPPQSADAVGRRLRHWLLPLGCGLWLTGCTSPSPAPAPTPAAAWQTQTGQAFWQARPHTPPLAGELVLAQRPDGDFFLQFSKPPLTLVEASRTGKRWRLVFPGTSREYRGRGAAGSRLLWLWLPAALDGAALPAHLHCQREADRWRLVNTRTGESLAGWLRP